VFYIALLFLILLGLIALVAVALNVGVLLTGVQLNLLIWHPHIPVLLLCVAGVFLGGLLLYVVSTFSARRDAREIKELRARTKELRERIEELEQAQVKTTSSGPLAGNFVKPAVPIPGFASSAPPAQGLFPPGSLPQRPLTGSLPQKPPSGALSNLSPGSSAIGNTPLSSRQGPPPPMPQTGGSRPPFFQQ
jgi:uncharacterized integral membrane protein